MDTVNPAWLAQSAGEKRQYDEAKKQANKLLLKWAIQMLEKMPAWVTDLGPCPGSRVSMGGRICCSRMREGRGGNNSGPQLW